MRTIRTPELPELLALLDRTDLSAHTINRHGYRVACVIGGDITDGPLDYSVDSALRSLQLRLAEAVGERSENYECYEVTAPDGQTLCLWFRDWKVTVGTATRPYES